MSTPKKRVPQAERTAVMKQRLSEAAFDVIKEVGYANFRTSAVSKMAGVSQGAQLHHYPTKDLLTIAAMEYSYEKTYVKFTQNLSNYKKFDSPLDAIIADAKDFFLSDSFMVALDILMAGGKNEELKHQLIGLAIESRTKIEAAWRSKLVEDGLSKEKAYDLVELTISLVRGFAVKSLISKDYDEFDRLMSLWKSIVTANK